MKNSLNKIKKSLLKLLACIPTALPKGMVEFDNWSNTIIYLYDLPNNDSVKFALATMILHLPSTAATAPLRYFGRCALKGASNQIASGVMQDLKAKQAEQIKAAEEANKAAIVV